MSAAIELLPPEVLDRLGGLDIVAKTVVRGFMGGIHKSPFLGTGDEFSRHRAYQQGDDVRHLDWRLYGRTDRLFVRQFREESNLQAMIVVDASSSMGFSEDGRVTKLRYSLFVAAALAHLMLRVGDAVGLASYGASLRLLLPPRNRPGQLHDLLVRLEALRPEGSGDGGQALDRVGESLRRTGRVILISDLLEEGDGASLVGGVVRLRARGDEVLVVRVATPLELGAVQRPAGRYYDPEAPDVEVATPAGLDEGHRQRVGRYYEDIATRLGEQGAEYLDLTTRDPLVPVLARWLRARAVTTT